MLWDSLRPAYLACVRLWSNRTRLDQTLSALIIYGILVLCVEAIYNGFTRGWLTDIDYAPWLPLGLRLFKAHSYSIILIGGWAIFMVLKGGWTGLFFVTFEYWMWEATSLVPDQMVKLGIFYNLPLYLSVDYIGAMFPFLIFFYLGPLRIRWLPSLAQWDLYWIGSILTGWNGYSSVLAEMIGQVAFVGMFFIFRVHYLSRPAQPNSEPKG